jgi:hypothetical protein
MWAKALLFCLVLMIAAPALAQEVPVPTVPAIPSPTLIPTATAIPTNSAPLPRSDVYNYLSTAAANVNALPDDVSAPGGAALLPSDDGRQLFGYAKWLLSGNSIRELVGPTIQPIGTTMFVWITLVIVLVAVYFTVRSILTIMKFVVWVFNFVRNLIPFV